MLVISTQDIMYFQNYVDKSIKNLDHKEKLQKAFKTGKPLLSKALLLLVIGADFSYIQQATHMPDPYLKHFLADFYELQGKYPMLVFMYPSFRVDPDIMNQVYYTATFNKNQEFLKQADQVISLYGALVKVNGKLVPVQQEAPKQDKHKSLTPDIPTVVPPEEAKIEADATKVLGKYSPETQQQMLDAIMKDPAGAIANFFQKRGKNGGGFKG